MAYSVLLRRILLVHWAILSRIKLFGRPLDSKMPIGHQRVAATLVNRQVFDLSSFAGVQHLLCSGKCLPGRFSLQRRGLLSADTCECARCHEVCPYHPVKHDRDGQSAACAVIVQSLEGLDLIKSRRPKRQKQQ